MSGIRKHKQLQHRNDGLENVLSRKGSKKSKIGANRYNGIDLLHPDTIRDIYESGGIGAKIITRVADDITRKGFKLTGSSAEDVMEKFDLLGGSNTFNTAIRWARAYGGSLIVVRINDGGDLTDPLTPDGEVEALDVYEAGCTNVVRVTEKYEDENNPLFGKPEIYQINSFDGVRFEVHESRCIRIDGRQMDSLSRSHNDGWHGSELQPVYEALLSMMSQLSSGEEVLNEMVIGTLKIENLDSLCVDSEGEALVKTRLELIDTSKSNENTIVIDMNEEYERHTVNLSGMSNIQHNAMVMVAGCADIPATYLFGTSPDGQNATGESDREQYYGKIDSERNYLYKPALLRLMKMLTSEKIKITFPSLQVSNLFDTSRAFGVFSKSIADLVDKGIITTHDAHEMLEKTEFISKISVLE